MFFCFSKRSVKLKNQLLYFPDHMVSDLEKSEITCLAANDWKSFIQSRSWEMKKGIKKEKKRKHNDLTKSVN